MLHIRHAQTSKKYRYRRRPLQAKPVLLLSKSNKEFSQWVNLPGFTYDYVGVVNVRENVPAESWRRKVGIAGLSKLLTIQCYFCDTGTSPNSFAFSTSIGELTHLCFVMNPEIVEETSSLPRPCYNCDKVGMFSKARGIFELTNQMHHLKDAQAQRRAWPTTPRLHSG